MKNNRLAANPAWVASQKSKSKSFVLAMSNP
jgi:hypothetical protein